MTQRSPIVAAMLLSDGVVDATDLARIGAAMRGWKTGILSDALELPATPRAWRMAQRDLLLCVLAVLIAPRGAGPATAAAKVVARVRRFGPGAILGPVDRLCGRLYDLGLPVPSERQTYNVLCRKSAINSALDYMIAAGIEAPGPILGRRNQRRGE